MCVTKTFNRRRCPLRFTHHSPILCPSSPPSTLSLCCYVVIPFRHSHNTSQNQTSTFCVPSFFCSYPDAPLDCNLSWHRQHNQHDIMHLGCSSLSCDIQQQSDPIQRRLSPLRNKFNSFRSGRGPALRPAGKCPSVSHSHPSRGCICRPLGLYGTRAWSPCYMLSRYPAPRRRSPLPRRPAPLPAEPPIRGQTRQWSPNRIG